MGGIRVTGLKSIEPPPRVLSCHGATNHGGAHQASDILTAEAEREAVKKAEGAKQAAVLAPPPSRKLRSRARVQRKR